jgi:thymidylate kinase
MLRRRKRLVSQRGLWVALLGPDGAGKSSVIEGIGTGHAAGFAGCASYHLRPTVGAHRNSATRNCDPHGEPPRGTLISVCKLVYLLIANWSAYLTVVRPQVAMGKLVLFDRYFPDCVADPKRYRLPASCRRLAETIAGLIPEPDLYVVLDAPASVLQRRKREVTFTESERQRNVYAMRLSGLPNAARVDAARPLARVVDEVVDRIIAMRLVRFRGQYEAA